MVQSLSKAGWTSYAAETLKGGGRVGIGGMSAGFRADAAVLGVSVYCLLMGARESLLQRMRAGPVLAFFLDRHVLALVQPQGEEHEACRPPPWAGFLLPAFRGEALSVFAGLMQPWALQ